MIEQTDVPAGRGPVAPPRPVLSHEVRASLEAVRVAREAAAVRARRQTMKTRLWFALSVAGIAAAGFVLGPRVAHRWRARAHVATPAHAAHPPAQPAPVTAPPVAAVAIADVPSASPVEIDAPAAPAPEPTTPAATARDVGSSDGACDTASIRRAPWRLSPDACARAFDADPNNPALALAVAHASLVRGRFADAAQWATRTLSLDPKAAEAYVIIARAGAAEGRQDDARAAYAHYLEIAPRGWHKAEARAALQKARATDSRESAGAR